MGEAIGATLSYAIGIAISPIPVAAVILMLFSGRARANSAAFSIAWLAGIATVVTVVVLIPGVDAGDSEPTSTTGWIKLGLGILLAVVGLRQWRSRPRGGEEAELPGWMARIDELRPGTALGLGFALSAVNPKNLLLAAAAGATLGALELTDGQLASSVAAFTVLAGLTVLVPVVAYQVAPERLAPALDRAKGWLIANNSTVLSVLFLVFSASLTGDAIQILG